MFTYICVTRDALGVCKDELAAKPLVLFESDDLVALASEEIAIRADHRPRDRYLRPVRVGGAGVESLVGERGISYDARGLAEPNAEAPKISEIDGDRAVFDAQGPDDAQDQPRAALAIYEQGIRDVTVRNPGSRHSLGVGILQRCKITFDGSLGYFGCGLIDGPEIHIKGRVGWSACENMMSGVVIVDGNGGSLTGAAMRGGDLVVRGRVGARTGHRPEGRHDHRRRLGRVEHRLHDAARPHDHLRRRRPRPRRLHVRRHDLRGRQGQVARHRLRARRVDRRATPS